jgi:alpha-beta hydrolase superfamily lysophospholipase
MILTQQDMQKLTQEMPELTFSPEIDCGWQKLPLAQGYLDYYGINFAQQYDRLKHGFGYINVLSFRIATHYWLPVNPRGTLVIMHGYYDHVGLFGHAIGFALDHNLAVLAFDLPGHGLSSGEPAEIDSFDEYGDVLAEILEQSAVIMPQNLYAMGQSTGCAVILNYLWRHIAAKNGVDPFKKLALCSPLVLPRTWSGWYMGKHIHSVLRHFAKRVARTFSSNSHDVKFLEFVQHQDPLQARYLSLRWLSAMKSWHKVFLGLPPLQKAILVVQGTADMTVDWKYNIPLIQKKLPNVKVAYIEDAGHQLVNESEYYRRAVFAAIEQHFFNSF